MSNRTTLSSELPALFTDDLPDTLTDSLLALAHLSDVDEDNVPKDQSGPVRRKRAKNVSKPYKTADDIFRDELKELEFRTNAWKPYKQKQQPKDDI